MKKWKKLYVKIFEHCVQYEYIMENQILPTGKSKQKQMFVIASKFFTSKQ